MPDIAVKIYLYLLIGSSVFWFLFQGVIWFFRRSNPVQSPAKARLLWLDLFFLLTGLLGMSFFVLRLLNNSLILAATFIMLVISTYAAEFVTRSRSKNVRDEGAT
jgi:hypothetical protein